MYDTKNKWIFIHPEKCGGVSIEQILMLHYGHDQVSMTYEDQHDSIDSIINMLKVKPHEYFKFGCIRNPWDRMVSLYYHAKTHDNLLQKHRISTFKDFLYFLNYESKKLSAEYKFKHNGLYVMDYVIQLENIEEDIKKLAELLHIKEYTIPHYDHQTNRPKIPYQEYYDNESRFFIQEKFKWDIDFFNYSFD